MKNPRKIDLIVVHCSASRVNQDFPIEALEACHKARGLRSIGYHYYITKDGVVYPCRPESEEGAHARHYNAHSIGICYEGGLDEKGKPADTRTPAQKDSLEDLLYSLALDYPDAEILGHRDLPWVRKISTTGRNVSTKHTTTMLFFICHIHIPGSFFLFLIKCEYFCRRFTGGVLKFKQEKSSITGKTNLQT